MLNSVMEKKKVFTNISMLSEIMVADHGIWYRDQNSSSNF